MISDVLGAIYGLIFGSAPAGIKRVFDPGKPFGPFRQNLPAIVILPSPDSYEAIYDSRESKSERYRVEISILVEDPFTRAEARERGDVSALTTYVEAVISLLESDPTLGGTVDELISATAGILGPQAVITATYVNEDAV